MIRRPGRLHKRGTPTIFPADGPPARRPRGHPERLDHVAARFHRRPAHAGPKTDGAPDVALLVRPASRATAGVVTQNALRAAPVVYDPDLLAGPPGRMRPAAMAR